LDKNIEYMPLFATSEVPPGGGQSDLFDLRRWIPSDNVSKAMVILDHELIGDTVIGAARAMLVGGEIAPVAIYSVGFRADRFGELYRKRADYLTMETADLAALGIEKTGGGPDLLAFLTNRVVPAIASDLPHLHDRPALAGFSLGGLFALRAAMQCPRLFGDVSAFSPSLFLAGDIKDALADLLSQDPSRRLFLAAGTLEDDRAQTGLQQPMYQMVARLGASLEADFGQRIVTSIVDGETHFSVPFSIVPAMLRHLFGVDRTAS
tara:strand:- start:2150 stop:2941 length:792 start_codon:yes stop_codon:yes gene_type:complete